MQYRVDASEPRIPRRLLIVSADIGEGHNSTGRAVAEAARKHWPDCEIHWLDTLEEMGPGVGAAFRWTYVTNVEYTPWLYDFFYRSLWKYRWFANACRNFVGAWSGRMLRRKILALRPDLVVSTYPLGTAGLAWLRRHGECPVPVTAIISDFSPHPFWVYSEIEQHYVVSEQSPYALRKAEPAASGSVIQAPVISGFHARYPDVARAHLGLPRDRTVVLISCGSLGFGSVDRAVDAVLAAGADTTRTTQGYRGRISRGLICPIHGTDPLRHVCCGANRLRVQPDHFSAGSVAIAGTRR